MRLGGDGSCPDSSGWRLRTRVAGVTKTTRPASLGVRVCSSSPAVAKKGDGGRAQQQKWCGHNGLVRKTTRESATLSE